MHVETNNMLAIPGSPRLAFSVHETAASLGLSTSSIWKWIASGKIRAVKVGGRTVVPTSELNRILSASTGCPRDQLGNGSFLPASSGVD